MLSRILIRLINITAKKTQADIWLTTKYLYTYLQVYRHQELHQPFNSQINEGMIYLIVTYAPTTNTLSTYIYLRNQVII